MAKQLKFVGQNVARVDGIEKVTGKAKYTGDLVIPGMLHGRILRSPYPHARIVAIDTSRAAALPGIREVATGKDTLGFKAGGIAAEGDEPYLALDKVRFIGDEVAAFIARERMLSEREHVVVAVSGGPRSQYHGEQGMGRGLEPLLDPQGGRMRHV